MIKSSSSVNMVYIGMDEDFVWMSISKKLICLRINGGAAPTTISYIMQPNAYKSLSHQIVAEEVVRTKVQNGTKEQARINNSVIPGKFAVQPNQNQSEQLDFWVTNTFYSFTSQ